MILAYHSRFMRWFLRHYFDRPIIMHEIHSRGPVCRHVLCNPAAGALGVEQVIRCGDRCES